MQLTPLSTHWAPRKKIKKGTIFFGHGVHEATSECGFVWAALEAARTRPAVLQTENSPGILALIMQVSCCTVLQYA